MRKLITFLIVIGVSGLAIVLAKMFYAYGWNEIGSGILTAWLVAFSIFIAELHRRWEENR